MKIFITGNSGFVGKSFVNYYNSYFNFAPFNRTETLNINEEVVLHFAGKAHDLKKTTAIEDYYITNTELTKKVFSAFLLSKATVFVTLSSVKAVADRLDCDLTEDYITNPVTHYGRSKLLADEYILSQIIPKGKRFYILRPCMIHGPGNKGNLNLLYRIVSKGLPWPLGKFENKRSFCSIENLCFIIKELIENEQIPSGVYNIADDEPLSTNEVINFISQSQGKRPCILNIPKYLITFIARFGDILKLPLNTERLIKLTESYIVSNNKIINAINKPLPVTSKDGLMLTFNSFKFKSKINNDKN